MTTKVASYCAQCRSRCGCNAVVEDGRLMRIEPLPEHPSGKALCPKGRAAPELIYHADRLTRPLRRTSPKGVHPATWEPIEWPEALDTIAGHMARIRKDHGAEQVAFAVTTPSGTQISDSISWIERFIRAFGSPNTIYGTEICNWHKDVATRFTYGTDIGTPDFANTDCVLLWGNNPTQTWLARAVEIQKARKKGAKLIVIDPRRTHLAGQADCWLQVKPGTDQVLALGLANLMIQSGGYDQSFVRDWTNGPMLVRTDTGAFLRESDLTNNGRKEVLLGKGDTDDDLLRYDVAAGTWQSGDQTAQTDTTLTVTGESGAIECQSAFRIFTDVAAQYPPEVVAQITGVPAEQMHSAVALLSENKRVAYYAWNGVSQSQTATQTERAISILYGLTGSYGNSGGNVPGPAAAFADISGQDLIDPNQRAKALGLKERPLGPGKSGWITARDAYKAVLSQTPYPLRMLFSFGGNLLASQPDTALARQAFEKLEFQVHTDFFLNATARYADIVLPAATSWERDALRPGFDASLEGMRRVQLRPAVIKPVGQARSDTDIVMALAKRLGMADQFFDGDVNRGRDYLLAPAGLCVADLADKPEGIELKTTVPLKAYQNEDANGQVKGFATPTRRLEIYSEQLLMHGYEPVPRFNRDDLPAISKEYPLTLSCAKTMAFCHSQHRNLESLRRLMPDPVAQMSPETAHAFDIKDGDWISITTSAGAFVARCQCVNDQQPTTVFTQHGWWVDDAVQVAAFHSDSGANDSSGAGSLVNAANSMLANMNQAIDTSNADPISGSVPMRCSPCAISRLNQQ